MSHSDLSLPSALIKYGQGRMDGHWGGSQNTLLCLTPNCRHLRWTTHTRWNCVLITDVQILNSFPQPLIHLQFPAFAHEALTRAAGSCQAAALLFSLHTYTVILKSYFPISLHVVTQANKKALCLAKKLQPFSQQCSHHFCWQKVERCRSWLAWKSAVWNLTFPSTEAVANTTVCANICARHFGNPKLCQIRTLVSVRPSSICSPSQCNVNGHLK